MIAFRNTLKTKAEAVALAQAHYDADNYIQGTFWEDGKGCSVGCMVHEYREKTGGDWHEATEPLYGIPTQLSFLQDRIFEGLPTEKAKEWTVRFFNAIPDGADLSTVTSRLMYWLMTDPGQVLEYADKSGTAAISTVAGLYKRRLEGDEPEGEEWENAAWAAEAAAWAAAEAWSARAAAWSARAAAEAAWAAARAAEAAAARAAAEAEAYEKIADKLIEILETSPVSKGE